MQYIARPISILKIRLICIPVLSQASARLNGDSVPDSLQCRDSEYNEIYDFIQNKLKHRQGGCIYITGVPGTGN